MNSPETYFSTAIEGLGKRDGTIRRWSRPGLALAAKPAAKIDECLSFLFAMGVPSAVVILVVILVVVLAAALLPTAVAIARQRRDRKAIIVLNVLLGMNPRGTGRLPDMCADRRPAEIGMEGKHSGLRLKEERTR